MSSNLTEPWLQVSAQVTATKSDIDTMLDATQVSIGVFTDSVNSTVDQLYVRAQQFSSDLTAYLGAPYKNLTAEDGPINTFSTKTEQALKNATTTAQNKAKEMTTSNKTPWNDGVTAINTWSKAVEDAYNKAVKKAQESAAAIRQANASVSTSSYTSGTSSSGSESGSSTGNKTTKTTTTMITGNNVKQLQKFLNSGFGAGLTVDGKYGSATSKAVKSVQTTVKNYLGNRGYRDLPTVSGKYDSKTRQTLITYWNLRASTDRQNREWWENNWKNNLPDAMYAKGTTATTKDQWAITDEPQFGDELVLVPGKDGNLSFMRKGTSIVPATITEELLKLADIGVDGLTMPKLDSGVNLMSNYISKPELSIDIENFLRCDNVSQDTMPELEKFVNKKMNEFMKQMNYAIRKFQ